MADLTRDYRIDYDTHRCYKCGRFWAIEHGLTGRCPRCALISCDDTVREQARLERVVRSLRGALTRAKGRGR